MNSDTIVKLILAAAGGVITLITLIGGLREGRESLKKLNEHLDQKEKAANEKPYESQGAHSLHS